MWITVLNNMGEQLKTWCTYPKIRGEELPSGAQLHGASARSWNPTSTLLEQGKGVGLFDLLWSPTPGPECSYGLQGEGSYKLPKGGRHGSTCL